MGTKTSKREKINSSSEENPVYEKIFRSYVTWNEISSLASDNPFTSTKNEINHFKNHNQTSKSSSNKQIQSEANQWSKNSLSYRQNVITAEQLIEKQSKRKEEIQYQSTKNLSNNSESISPKSLNRFHSLRMRTTDIPSDLQLVLIDQNHLQNAQEIGKGNFGTVYRAIYKGNRDVALKMLKCRNRNGSDTEYQSHIFELLHEAHIMTCLKHSNLLNILGVTFFGKDKQLSLITELMSHGSLLDYLNKSREHFIQSNSKEITNKLNHFAKQIFNAMFYLEERQIIHRDLAARNCLIGEDHSLKVADFGLTKLTDCGLYRGNPNTICAVRWTSPEALFDLKYTSRSDVWSYGITLWEIYSLGQRPYTHLNNQEIKTLLKNISKNVIEHLPQSDRFGSDQLYTHIISLCLTRNALLRPSFRDLTERISNILNQ